MCSAKIRWAVHTRLIALAMRNSVILKCSFPLPFLQGCRLVIRYRGWWERSGACTTSFLAWPLSQRPRTRILVSGEACLSWVDQPGILAARKFLRRAWAVVEPCGKPSLVWVLYFQSWGLVLFRTYSASAQPGFGFGVAEPTHDRQGVLRGPAISCILLPGLVFVYIIIVRVKLCMFQLWVWFVRDVTYVVMSVSDCRSLMQRYNIRRSDVCTCNVVWAKQWKR